MQRRWKNYKIWANGEARNESSILYDTVAAHLVYSTEYLKMQELNVTVNDDGFTVIDPNGKKFNYAIDWIDLEGYEKYLVDRLPS